MEKSSRYKVKKLSTDFVRDAYKDGSKKILLPGKWVLQTILAWPDTDNKCILVFNYICMINVAFMVITHASYVVVNRKDVGNAIMAAVTVQVLFEDFIRLFVIVTRRHILNNILYIIWKQFWPIAVLDDKKIKLVTRKCYITIVLVFGCYASAAFSSIILTLGPYLTHEGLIMKSIFPFEWNRTITYESVYIWQYITFWHAFHLINGFDFLIIPVVMISAVQFVILKDVFENIFSERSHKQRILLFGKRISERDIILKCLEHQIVVKSVCDQLEGVFRFAMVFEFLWTTAAACFAALVLRVAPDRFMQMLTYAMAHMFQLFYYCFVGNELTVQSENVLDGIYNSGWHESGNKEFKKSLTLIIQSYQKPQVLTAAGIIDVNFISYISVLKICFSFYTFLDKLIISGAQ